MQQPVFAGYTVEQISGKLLDEIVDSRANSKKLEEIAEYLGRAVSTLETWMGKRKPELSGETVFFALGVLEKNGRIPPLPAPSSDRLEQTLCVAFARKQVPIADVAADLDTNKTSRLYELIRRGTMVSLTRYRLLWSLSKRQVIDWEWLTKLPKHTQCLVAYIVHNPHIELGTVEASVPATIGGRSAIMSLLTNPATFVNEELKNFLLTLAEVPEYVGMSQRYPVLRKESVPISNNAESSSLVSLIAQMNPASRIIATAELLLAELRLTIGNNRQSVTEIADACEELRLHDKRQTLFRLENALSVINTGEEKTISRWLKEEIR